MSAIIISPTIFPSIEERPGLHFHLFSKLQSKNVVWDKEKNLETECISEFSKLPKTKQLMEASWAHLRTTVNKNAMVQKRSPKEFNKLKSEIIIAENNNDYILYNGEIKIDFSHLDKTIKLSDFLSLNFIERKVLKPEEEFKFTDWIKKYVENSIELSISDRYLNRRSAIYNLEKILSYQKRGANITLKTMEECKASIDGIVAKFEGLQFSTLYFTENEIKKGSEAYKNFLHTRTIETNRFVIDMANGLDFTYGDKKTKHTKVAVENTITVFEKV